MPIVLKKARPAPLRQRPYSDDPTDPAQLGEGQEEDQSPESWFTLPNALRIGGGVVGGLAGSFIPGAGTAAGAAIGGGLGAAAGEGLAELMEIRRKQRTGFNPAQIATQGAIGAIPMGGLGSIAGGAIKGAALGAGSTVMSRLAEAPDLMGHLTGTARDDLSEHLPSLGDVGHGALAGGVFGGAASGILSRFARPTHLPGGESGAGQTAAVATAGERPLPVRPHLSGLDPREPPPPGGGPRTYMSAVSPRFESFPPPPERFPDPIEMAMAHQPNLPGAVQAGGRRMGGFDQGSNLPPLPEGFDELNAILRGEDAGQLGSKLDSSGIPPPALTRPLLESGLHPQPSSIAPTPWDRQPAPTSRWEPQPPPPPGDLSRPPGPFPSRTRPLHPSGLDAAPPVLEAPVPDRASVRQTSPTLNETDDLIRQLRSNLRDIDNVPPGAEPAAPVEKLIGSGRTAAARPPGPGSDFLDALAQRAEAEQPPVQQTAVREPLTYPDRPQEPILDKLAQAEAERGIGPPPKPGRMTLPEPTARLNDKQLDDLLGGTPARAERRRASMLEGAPTRRVGDRSLPPPESPESVPPPAVGGYSAAPGEPYRPGAEGPPVGAPEPPKATTPVRTASTTPSKLNLEEVDPDSIGVDAKTYQFKGGGDAAGATDRLKGVQSWDPMAGSATPIVVHERADGSRFVVDGHQRLALAKRMKAEGRPVPNLHAIVLREGEGVTVEGARRVGAMLNLQQGTGTATDVAKVLRSKPLSDRERARIPKDQTSGAKLRMGEDLSQLGDTAFTRVVNGQVDPNPARNESFGAIVGRLIPDHEEQVSALQQLAKHAPDNAYQAEQFVKATIADGFERGVQTNLFGESEVANSLADPIARIMAAARRALTSEKSALGNALRNEGRLTSRGNVLNKAANQAGFEQAGTLDRLLDTYGHTAGPVREELKRVAAQVQRGELTPAAASDQLLAAVERERGTLGGGRAARPSDAGSGRAPAAAAPAPLAQEGPPAPPQPRRPVAPAAAVPQATPAEVPGILKELADTLNVKNKPLVDELPPLTLQGEKLEAPVSRAEKEAGGQGNIFEEESAAGARKVARGDYSQPASADLPPELKALSDMGTRHEVRNPTKAAEIAESMKKVGWKGRKLLVVKQGDKETAWTGTHRLEAAKLAGLTPDQVPRITVDAAVLEKNGYNVEELTKLGKKARIEALRKSGQGDAADLLQEEVGAKAARERGRGSRAAGENPRAQGKNPRALKTAEEHLNEGNIDEAERMMSQEIEGKIKSAFRHGTGKKEDGTTLVGGALPFDTETFRRLVAKHPESAWKATTTAIGGATGWYLDEDHPGRGAILGMLAGAAAGNMPRLVRALQTAELKTGSRAGVEPVRLARDPKKDIGLFELVGGTPERTIPEQFEKARPAYEKFLKALREEHARTQEPVPQKKVQAIRDRYMTPAIAAIRRDAKLAMADKANRQPYKASYITAFANRLAGHRTIGQRVVQALSKGKIPPDFIERRVAGGVYYVGTGFGVDTALQNLTQPALALGHVPFKFIAQAYKDLASNPAAKRLVEGALLPLEKPTDAIELTLGDFGRKVSKLKDKLPDPQKLLRMTDQKNREVVYYAARKYAESQGLETAAADTWAHQVMRKTQAEPGSLGTNPFHAGPVSGSMRPFTKYPTVFTEHLLDVLKQASHGKNLGGAARLGGSLLAMAALGRATGIDLEDLLISGGRPLGLDVSHPGRSLERVATGQATPTSRGVFDLLEHLKGGADHSLGEDVGNIVVPRYARKLKDAVSHFQREGSDAPHVSRGPGGKIRDVNTPGETVLNLLGLKTTRQTARREALTDFYDTATKQKETYETARRKAYEDLSRAIDAGDAAGSQDAIRRIGSTQAVRQFLRERRLLPEERFFKTLPPKIRQQLRGALNETRDLAPAR